MELNREQIIKALEWCTSGGNCMDCEEDKNTPNLSQTGCMAVQMRKALALIRELTEANKRLTSLCTSKDIIVSDLNAENTRLRKEVEYWEAEVKEARADIDQSTAEARAYTVREMAKRLKEHLEKPEFPWDSFTVAEEVIDQIAKEMLEEE